jgi:hypothetical protein
MLDTSYLEGEAEIVVGRWDDTKIIEPRMAVASGFSPRLSPDGRWLAYLVWSEGSAAGAVRLRVQELGPAQTFMVTDRFLVPTYFEYPLDWLAVNYVWSDDGTLLFCDRDASHRARIARFAPGVDQEPHAVAELPSGDIIVRDLWPSSDGRQLAYNRYNVQSSVILVRDLSSGTEQEWFTDRHGRQGGVKILGWLDGRLLAVRSRRTEGLPSSMDFLTLEGPNRQTVLFKDLRGYPGTARLDLEHRRVVVTLRDATDNLFALKLDGGPPMQLTTNDRASVTFSNVEFDRKGTLVYSRHDGKQDIWLVRGAERD